MCVCVTHTHIQTHIHISVYMHVYLYIYNIHRCLCVCVCVCVCIYIYIYIYIYMHVYAYTLKSETYGRRSVSTHLSLDAHTSSSDADSLDNLLRQNRFFRSHISLRVICPKSSESDTYRCMCVFMSCIYLCTYRWVRACMHARIYAAYVYVYVYVYYVYVCVCLYVDTTTMCLYSSGPAHYHRNRGMRRPL